jgi:hypothetical protein
VASAVAEERATSAHGSGDEEGTLDKEYIRRRVRKVVPLVRECYELALREHPQLSGRMDVEFVIIGEEGVGGLVETSQVKETSTLNDPVMVECVRETMYALQLQPPKGGGRVVVRYPFEFSSDGERVEEAQQRGSRRWPSVRGERDQR